MAEIHKLIKDGSTIFPATITDAIVHQDTGRTLTSMIKDYNLSELFPAEGVNGGNKYNLTQAIQVLGSHLTAAEKTGGIRIIFISTTDPYPVEEWFLRKGTWSTDEKDWRGLDEEPTPDSYNYVNSNSLAAVYGSYENDNEFLEVKTDGEGKILEGIKNDGTKTIGLDLEVGGNIKTKGNITAEGNSIVKGNLTVEGTLNAETELNKIIFLDDDPEFVDVKTDEENKILEAIKADGTKVIGTDFEVEGNSTIKGNLTVEGTLSAETELNKIMFLDNDPEGRVDIKEDAESKIVSYRDDSGVLHEEAGIKTSKLELTSDGMTDFQRALKESGFSSGAGDWSDSKSLEIPIPRCALVNITNDRGNATWPTSKSDRSDYNPGVNADLHYYMEFWDMQGNFFKKEIIMSAQGNSSMALVKKNGAADFCNNNGWDDDDTFSIKFGDWVPQDSFHFKAYYTDYLRGSCVVSYQLADEVYKTRGVFKDRPWKEALIDFDSVVLGAPTNCTSDGIKDTSLQMDTGARCMPDGFPCVFYLNGEFYGLYSWQLKKHRDNYHMDRNEKKHIHIDGDLTVDYFWNPANGIDWTKFEVRNPKPKSKKWILYCQDESAYNGDDPHELYGPANSGDDTNHKNSAYVKESISNLPLRIQTIKNNAIIPDSRTAHGDIMISKYGGLYNSQTNYGKGTYVKNDQGSYYMSKHSTNTGNPLTDTENWVDVTNDIAQLKSQMETYFDKENLIDYEIINMAVDDSDGFGKNWQWTTWDGEKWYVNQYDKDLSFGNHHIGYFTRTPSSRWLGNDINTPIGWAILLYQDEIKERWNNLTQKGILTSENLISKVEQWMNRIGLTNYEKEWEKWPDSPCNRDSGINYEYWVFTGEFVVGNIPSGGNLWNESTSYSVNDIVWVLSWDSPGFNQYIKFKSVKSSTGQNPITKTYTDYTPYNNNYPTHLGYRDSLWRFTKFIEQNISYKNNFINSLL